MESTKTAMAPCLRIVHDYFHFGPAGTVVSDYFTTPHHIVAQCTDGFKAIDFKGTLCAMAGNGNVSVILPEPTTSIELRLAQGANPALLRIIDENMGQLDVISATKAVPPGLDTVSYYSPTSFVRIEIEWPSSEGGLADICYIGSCEPPASGRSAVSANQSAMGVGPAKRPARAPRQGTDSDLDVAEPVDMLSNRPAALGSDRLLFDGYALTWHGEKGASWPAFSGAADESVNEAVKDIGPTPQGLFVIDPVDIQKLEPTDDWGSHRVRIVPLAATVNRMSNCLKVIRTGMYIHGGDTTGTHGCIELNDDADELNFFKRLAAYGAKIELEVKYVGAREQRYEFPSCPY